MFKSKVILFAIIISSLFNVHATAQEVSWAKPFKSPDMKYRPVPFWHLNGTLTKDEIYRQVNDAAKNGFGGVAILPVTAGAQYPTNLPSPGMSPVYLSEPYFDRYKDILDAAKARGIQVILYDDIDFPSGTAGGSLQKSFPGMTRKVLEKKDTTFSGPLTLNITLPQGINMAVVGYDEDTKKRVNLSSLVKDGSLTWNVPAGKWKVSIFTCRLNADATVDFMDPAAVKEFIKLTYEQYAKRFSPYFGNVIKNTFFDDVGYVFMERGWTAAFNHKFKERFGKDPALYYPALWEDIGPETEAARVAFFDTRAELMAEGFPKLITAWDKQHGLKSSGHPPGNYEIQPVDMNFDIFKFNRYQDIPTMDAIFYHGHGREGFKLVSSAAVAYDRPVVAAEIYGAFQESKFTVNTLYQAAMEIFVRGINFLVPHGMWFDPKPQSVRIPPLISPYSTKLQPSLNKFNDFAARASMMLTGGRQVAEIGIIYPIAALQGFYHFEAKDNPGVGKFVAQGTDYLAIGDELTNNIHRDFTFIHPELFTGANYTIANKQVILNNKIGKQVYKVIIIPGGKVISYHTLKKIQQFYQQGGKVIATSVLPTKSAEFGLDKGVNRIVKEMFSGTAGESGSAIKNNKGGIALFLPKPDSVALAKVLATLEPNSDVLIKNDNSRNSGNGRFSYIHKVKDGKQIYYFANSTTDEISTEVLLRGKMLLSQWDPHTGEKNTIKNMSHLKRNNIWYTKVQLKLASVKSVFIVGK